MLLAGILCLLACVLGFLLAKAKKDTTWRGPFLAFVPLTLTLLFIFLRKLCE